MLFLQAIAQIAVSVLLVWAFFIICCAAGVFVNALIYVVIQFVRQAFQKKQNS